MKIENKSLQKWFYNIYRDWRGRQEENGYIFYRIIYSSLPYNLALLKILSQKK